MKFLEMLLKPICTICKKMNQTNTVSESFDRLRDKLTGLYSLSYFDEKLIHEQARFARYESQFSVVILKLDDLSEKPAVKEKKLWEASVRHAGQIILSELRNVDVVARYSSTSFIMLLPQTKILHARFVAERLRAMIKDKKLQFDNSEYTLTACLSVGEQIKEHSSEEMLHRLDTKLKEMSARGKDQVGIAADEDGSVPFEEE